MISIHQVSYLLSFFLTEGYSRILNYTMQFTLASTNFVTMAFADFGKTYKVLEIENEFCRSWKSFGKFSFAPKGH